VRGLFRLDVLQHGDEMAADLTTRPSLLGRSVRQTRHSFRQTSRCREMAALRVRAIVGPIARRVVEQ